VTVRIAGGQGFYGDTPAAVDALLADGVDYLCLEALAELTLAILQKDRQRDETRGYTRDLPQYLAKALPAVAAGRTKLITNAGGINPTAAARAAVETAKQFGVSGLEVATVLGDQDVARRRRDGDVVHARKRRTTDGACVIDERHLVAPRVVRPHTVVTLRREVHDAGVVPAALTAVERRGSRRLLLRGRARRRWVWHLHPVNLARITGQHGLHVRYASGFESSGCQVGIVRRRETIEPARTVVLG
jgi:hypothetical protein